MNDLSITNSSFKRNHSALPSRTLKETQKTSNPLQQHWILYNTKEKKIQFLKSIWAWKFNKCLIINIIHFSKLCYMLVYLRLNLFKYQIITTTVSSQWVIFISANFQKHLRDTNHWKKQILNESYIYLSNKLSHLK